MNIENGHPNVALPAPLATDWDSENALWVQGVSVATPALQNAIRRSPAVSNINVDEY
jgi:hypothetical protein